MNRTVSVSFEFGEFLEVASDEGNWFNSASLDMDLTLRLVEQEIIIEQVVERLLHILNSFGGLAMTVYVYYVVWEIVTVSCFLVTFLVERVTFCAFITHKAIVRIGFVTSLVNTSLTFRSNGQDEEQLTDRHVHSLNRNDIVSKETREDTANQREHYGFERTAVLSVSRLLQKGICFVFEQYRHVFLKVTLKTCGKTEFFPVFSDCFAGFGLCLIGSFAYASCF